MCQPSLWTPAVTYAFPLNGSAAPSLYYERTFHMLLTVIKWGNMDQSGTMWSKKGNAQGAALQCNNTVSNI